MEILQLAHGRSLPMLARCSMAASAFDKGSLDDQDIGTRIKMLTERRIALIVLQLGN